MLSPIGPLIERVCQLSEVFRIHSRFWAAARVAAAARSGFSPKMRMNPSENVVPVVRSRQARRRAGQALRGRVEVAQLPLHLRGDRHVLRVRIPLQQRVDHLPRYQRLALPGQVERGVLKGSRIADRRAGATTFQPLVVPPGQE